MKGWSQCDRKEGGKEDEGRKKKRKGEGGMADCDMFGWCANAARRESALKSSDQFSWSNCPDT